MTHPGSSPGDRTNKEGTHPSGACPLWLRITRGGEFRRPREVTKMQDKTAAGKVAVFAKQNGRRCRQGVLQASAACRRKRGKYLVTATIAHNAKITRRDGMPPLYSDHSCFGVCPYFFLYNRMKKERLEKPQRSATSDTLYSPLCSFPLALERRRSLR